MVATGKGASAGVLVKSAEALETAHELDTVVLDRTGTLTRGKPALTDVVPVGRQDETELLRLLASAELDSEHPLAAAVVAGARDPRPGARAGGDLRLRHGQGHPATVDGRELLVGNARLLRDAGIDTAELVQLSEHVGSGHLRHGPSWLSPVQAMSRSSLLWACPHTSSHPDMLPI